jgi:hypothetical protein
MKTAIGHLFVALLLALGGWALWTAGHAERRLIDTHEQLLTLQFPAVTADAPALDTDLNAAARAPWLGPALRADARQGEAVAGYWQARYQDLEPKTDAAGSVVETDPRMLLVSANAAFRAAQAEEADRATMVKRYEAVMTSYEDVLRADPSLVDAAYNFEYVVRLRNEAAKPGRKAGEKEKAAPPPPPTLHGRPGGPPKGIDMGDFKIVVPKRMEEREDEATQPGGEAKRKRRG